MTMQGFGNAGAPTVQPETEEERRRREAQAQNFQQPQVQGPPVTGVHQVDGTWGNNSKYGVADDVSRYRGMASRDLGPGARIDQEQANQARGLQGEGMGMLGERARGATTPAQYMLGQQTRGAVDAVRSNAAGIRGGAAARAAAGQSATQIGGRVQAQGDQDRLALGARESADATGQLLGASTEQRGQDLNVATDQAKLEQQQRALAAQAKNNYEGLSYDVKSAALGQQVGRSAADQNAANADRKQSLAESQAAWGVTKDVGGAAVGGAAGGIQAYDKSQQPAKPNPYDYAGSDPRTKTNVRDIKKGTPKERLRSRVDTSGTNYEDGYDNGMFRKNDEGPPRSLTDGIDSAQAKSGDIERKNPHGDGPTGGPGYAQRRAGQPGGMFGNQAATHKSAQEDPFAKPKRFNNAKDQAISMSDKRTKKPVGWLDEYMANEEKATDYEDDDESAKSPKERLRERAEAKDLGDVDDPKFNPKAPEMPAPAKRMPRMAQEFERPIRPSDQRAIDEMRTSQEAQNAMLGEPATQRAIFKDSPLEEDRGDRYAREGGRRDVAMSDPKAKEEAFRMGVAAGKAGDKPPPAPESPKREDAPKTTDSAATHNAKKIAPRMQQLINAPAMPGAFDPTLADKAVTGAKELYRSVVDAPQNFRNVGTSATMSDPDTKLGVRETPMSGAMRAMAPSSYEYRPEFAAKEGQRPGEKNVGPMADKMKADPIARTAIVEDPEPPHLLAIDKSKGLKLALGGLSDLQRQIDQLKQRRSA